MNGGNNLPLNVPISRHDTSDSLQSDAHEEISVNTQSPISKLSTQSRSLSSEMITYEMFIYLSLSTTCWRPSRSYVKGWTILHKY